MRSSTSSSDAEAAAVLGLQGNAFVRGPLQPRGAPSGTNAALNAHRGEARVVPAVPWPQVFVGMLVMLALLLGAWEYALRGLGLRAGDLDDGRDYWAVERRKVDLGPRDSVVIIGDSRMLYDTDLATWQRLTGRRPIQLALPATNAQNFLHDLATDEHFAGLLVIGTAELSYFRDGDGGSSDVLEYVKSQTPSQKSGQMIYKELSRHLAFLDTDYTLFRVIERREWADREGVDGPYGEVWKLSESTDDRQSWLWDRLEKDPYLLEHARRVWKAVYPSEPVAADVVDRTIARAKADVQRIRARGGEVVWVRPPSSGVLLEREHARFPRAKIWDRLLGETGCFGVHFEDYPQMQNLSLPDWSHLARRSALGYTQAYVQVLADHVAWLKSHAVTDAAVQRTP